MPSSQEWREDLLSSLAQRLGVETAAVWHMFPVLRKEVPKSPEELGRERHLDSLRKQQARCDSDIRQANADIDQLKLDLRRLREKQSGLVSRASSLSGEVSQSIQSLSPDVLPGGHRELILSLLKELQSAGASSKEPKLSEQVLALKSQVKSLEASNADLTSRTGLALQEAKRQESDFVKQERLRLDHLYTALVDLKKMEQENQAKIKAEQKNYRSAVSSAMPMRFANGTKKASTVPSAGDAAADAAAAAGSTKALLRQYGASASAVQMLVKAKQEEEKALRSAGLPRNDDLLGTALAGYTAGQPDTDMKDGDAHPSANSTYDHLYKEQVATVHYHARANRALGLQSDEMWVRALGLQTLALSVTEELKTLDLRTAFAAADSLPSLHPAKRYALLNISRELGQVGEAVNLTKAVEMRVSELRRMSLISRQMATAEGEKAALALRQLDAFSKLRMPADKRAPDDAAPRSALTVPTGLSGNETGSELVVNGTQGGAAANATEKADDALAARLRNATLVKLQLLMAADANATTGVNASASSSSDDDDDCLDMPSVYEGIRMDGRSSLDDTLLGSVKSLPRADPAAEIVAALDSSVYDSSRPTRRRPCKKKANTTAVSAPAPAPAAIDAAPALAPAGAGGATSGAAAVAESGGRARFASARRGTPPFGSTEDFAYNGALQPDSNIVLGRDDDTGLYAVQRHTARSEKGCHPEAGQHWCEALGRCINPSVTACVNPLRSLSQSAEALHRAALAMKSKMEGGKPLSVAPPPTNRSVVSSNRTRGLNGTRANSTTVDWASNSTTLRGVYYLTRALSRLMPNSAAAKIAHKRAQKALVEAGVQAAPAPVSILQWHPTGLNVSDPVSNASYHSMRNVSGLWEQTQVEAAWEKLLAKLRLKIAAEEAEAVAQARTAANKAALEASEHTLEAERLRLAVNGTNSSRMVARAEVLRLEKEVAQQQEVLGANAEALVKSKDRAQLEEAAADTAKVLVRKAMTEDEASQLDDDSLSAAVKRSQKALLNATDRFDEAQDKTSSLRAAARRELLLLPELVEEVVRVNLELSRHEQALSLASALRSAHSEVGVSQSKALQEDMQAGVTALRLDRTRALKALVAGMKEQRQDSSAAAVATAQASVAEAQLGVAEAAERNATAAFEDERAEAELQAAVLSVANAQAALAEALANATAAANGTSSTKAALVAPSNGTAGGAQTKNMSITSSNSSTVFGPAAALEEAQLALQTAQEVRIRAQKSLALAGDSLKTARRDLLEAQKEAEKTFEEVQAALKQRIAKALLESASSAMVKAAAERLSGDVEAVRSALMKRLQDARGVVRQTKAALESLRVTNASAVASFAAAAKAAVAARQAAAALAAARNNGTARVNVSSSSDDAMRGLKAEAVLKSSQMNTELSSAAVSRARAALATAETQVRLLEQEARMLGLILAPDGSGSTPPLATAISAASGGPVRPVGVTESDAVVTAEDESHSVAAAAPWTLAQGGPSARVSALMQNISRVRLLVLQRSVVVDKAHAAVMERSQAVAARKSALDTSARLLQEFQLGLASSQAQFKETEEQLHDLTSPSEAFKVNLVVEKKMDAWKATRAIKEKDLRKQLEGLAASIARARKGLSNHSAAQKEGTAALKLPQLALSKAQLALEAAQKQLLGAKQAQLRLEVMASDLMEQEMGDAKRVKAAAAAKAKFAALEAAGGATNSTKNKTKSSLYGGMPRGDMTLADRLEEAEGFYTADPDSAASATGEEPGKQAVAAASAAAIDGDGEGEGEGEEGEDGTASLRVLSARPAINAALGLPMNAYAASPIWFVGGYNHSLASAQKTCETSRGPHRASEPVTVCSLNQMSQAAQAGFSSCKCGWSSTGTRTAESTAKYQSTGENDIAFPMARPVAGCGQAGLNFCNWQTLSGVYCCLLPRPAPV